MRRTEDSIDARRGGADAHGAAYRPDIDGLRAIAVLSVVAYHLHDGLLPGGYLGVDIFFVISGFLITQIIHREIGAGAFTLAKFYERRIRRIMPALLFVLAATTVAAALILLPADLAGFGKSVFATLAFAANIYFWRDSDYFSRAADEKPLLHLWSLGVEEQFYIFFPLLLLLLKRFGVKQTLLVAAALLVGSFALDALLRNIGGANPAFYLLPTRAWEMMAGACLAIAAPKLASQRLADGLGLAGLGLLAIALVFPHGGLWGLAPPGTLAVAGAAALIVAGSGGGGAAGRLLSLPLMRGVGLISYSLYLWHWPILVLLRYRTLDDPGPVALALALVAMFAAAYVSWRFVEKPFRTKAMPVGRVLAVTGAGTGIAAIAAAVLVATNGLPNRLPADAARINAAAGGHFRCAVQDYVTVGGARGCRMNLPSGRPDDADFALIGNSHALMYTPLVADLLAQRGLKGVLLNANACLPSARINISEACLGQAARYLEGVETLPAKVVLIGVRWDLDPADRFIDASGRAYSNAEGFTVGLQDTIRRLEAAGKTVVLIGPIAQPNWDVASVFSRSLAFGAPLNRPLAVSRADFEARMAPQSAPLSAEAGVLFVSMADAQCDAVQCPFVADGRSLFSDSHHLTMEALPRFAAPLGAALDAALAQSGPVSGPAREQ